MHNEHDSTALPAVTRQRDVTQVGLAVRLQDGVKFREGMGVSMSVQPAKFEQHGEAYVPKKKVANSENSKHLACTGLSRSFRYPRN